MHEKSITLLCDPIDGSELHLKDAVLKDGKIYSGILKSDKGREFPIVNGIPRFICGEETEKEKRTKVNFQKEWKYFNKFDGFMGSGELFKSFIYPLGENDIKGKTVLECDCGGGRWLRVAAEWKAELIIGIDYSESVEDSQKLCRDYPNVDVIQASMFRMPVKQNYFDVVYSIGVIHHLRNPREGLKNIFSLAKSGGKVAIWVYSLEGAKSYLALSVALRRLGPKLGHIPRLTLSFLLGTPLLILVRWINPLLRRMKIIIPLSGYMYNILRKLEFENLCSVVYDQMCPSIAKYFDKDELIEMISSLGPIEKIMDFSLREGNGWRVVFKK